jgi:hyperosmotically inducible periplasmic protein
MNRNTRSMALTAIIGSFALVACANSDAPRLETDADSVAAPADRSAPRGDQTTAIDQSNSSEHIDITARIRRAVMDDDALSTGAKNSTIVTDRTGTVTLRGYVQDQAEKTAIAAMAAAVVGAERVVNQLVINP